MPLVELDPFTGIEERGSLVIGDRYCAAGPTAEDSHAATAEEHHVDDTEDHQCDGEAWDGEREEKSHLLTVPSDPGVGGLAGD